MNESRIRTCKCGRQFLEVGDSSRQGPEGIWCYECHMRCPFCRFEMSTDSEGHFGFIPVGLFELPCGCVIAKDEGMRPRWPRMAELCDDKFHYCDDERKEDWLAEHIKNGLMLEESS